MIEAFPLSWPSNKLRTPAGDRKRAQFSSSDTQTRKNWDGSTYSYKSKKTVSVSVATTRLLAEIDRFSKVGHSYRIDREDVIVSTNVRLRRDGLPYSGEREPDDPGAAVYFKLDDVQYCFPCDKWDRVADNIAAIAAHLSAMRGMERWGVGESHDVFAGFKALPEKITLSCWEVLDMQPTRDVDMLKRYYRVKALKHHPDLGGSTEKFSELTNAYEQALLYANSK